MKTILIIASISGFLAVMIGAIGAHALKDILEQVGKVEQFETGNRYHWYHTLILFGLAWLHHTYGGSLYVYASWSFLLGILLFTCSLYAYSLTGTKVFAHITPFGGLAFLAGWGLTLTAIFKSNF